MRGKQKQKDMKKYWIKDLEWNQVIHAPTLEIADKLCKRFNELGMKWRDGKSYLEESNWNNFQRETCYNPYGGHYSEKNFYVALRDEILTIDQLLDFQTNEYPKVMEVSYHGDIWCKRVVFMEKNGKFLAWLNAETIEEAEHITDVRTWPFAREIQPASTLELTIDQIADKFNVSPEQIKIKK